MKDDGRSKTGASELGAEIDEARAALVRFVLEEASREALTRPPLLSADLTRLIGDAVQARVALELAQIQQQADDHARAAEDRVFVTFERNVLPKLDELTQDQRGDIERLEAAVSQLRADVQKVLTAKPGAPAPAGRAEVLDVINDTTARIEARLSGWSKGLDQASSAPRTAYVAPASVQNAPASAATPGWVDMLTSRAALGAMLVVVVMLLAATVIGVGVKQGWFAKAASGAATVAAKSGSPVERGFALFVGGHAADAVALPPECRAAAAACTYDHVVRAAKPEARQAIIAAAVRELVDETQCGAPPPALTVAAPSSQDVARYAAVFTCVGTRREVSPPPTAEDFKRRDALLDRMGEWAFSGLARDPKTTAG